MTDRRKAFLAIVGTAGLGLAAADARIVRLDGTRMTTSDVDTTVERLMRAADVTGAAVAIFNNRRPVHVKAYGLRDADAGRTADDRLRDGGRVVSPTTIATGG